MAMALPTREKLQESELVFRAKVAQVGASTMLELPASDTTTVVRVEEVYRSPETVRFLPGKSITVVTRDTGSLHAGEEVLFLTKVWLYGESLAVVEVGMEPVDMDHVELRQHFRAEAEAAKDDMLRDRITNASLVVVGKVIGTTPVQVQDPATMSEHAPMWSAAIVQVINIEKGSLSSNEVEVLYPQSRDVMWYRAPKFRTGQEGVWILRNQRIEDINREGFTALDPLDFHSTQALEQIRRLIQRR
jgi:hypothetical protein